MRPPKIPYVETITGSPNLRYKRRVPPDLQDVIGKKLWTQSLRTASLREAERLASALRVKHDREIDAARGVLDLTPEERERIDAAGGVGGFLQDLDEQARDAKRLDSESEHMRDVAGLRPIETAFGVWRDPVEVSGDDDDVPDPVKARIKIAALEAEAQAIRDQLARDAVLTAKVRPLHPTPRRLPRRWRRCRWMATAPRWARSWRHGKPRRSRSPRISLKCPSGNLSSSTGLAAFSDHEKTRPRVSRSSRER